MPVSHRGELGDGLGIYKCLVHDVSIGGMLIVCTEKFKIGEIVDLTCALTPDFTLQCKIEVRHYDEDGMGAKIVQISESAAADYKRYVDSFYSDDILKFR
jgi:hypothetical protein